MVLSLLLDKEILMSKKFDLKDKVKTKEDKEFYDKYMKLINDVKGNKNLSKEKKLESFFEQLNKWEDEEENS